MRRLTTRLGLPSLGAMVWLVLAWTMVSALAADPTFPALTGRVVDAAGLLKPEEKAGIEAKLKAYEDKTSDQVVVATVPDLQGLTIEDYGNRLFRTWAIGQAKTNNGALLLVAPSDRKVRIEVGYGLEGALTDALSKVVIATTIAPRFKQGDFAGGIEAGVDAMLSILSGDADEWQRRAPPVRADTVRGTDVMFWMVVILVVVLVIWRMNAGPGGARRRGRRGNGGIVVLPSPSSGGWGGGFSDGGGFGGGFSGGGGSSGGGGASGDW